MENEFIDLLNSNRALVFKVCNLYCDDSETRKDLFQEIVLQLWKSFPAFRNESAKSTWVYRVALNTAISNFRKESKKPARQTLDIAALEIPDMPDDMNDQENIGMLNSAIKNLTEIEKATILLYLDEKTYEEISDIMGISISNVGVRLNRIKNKLSEIIKTY